MNFQLPIAMLLLLRGYRVFMPDYIGLGSAGLHALLNRVEWAMRCSTGCVPR